MKTETSNTRSRIENSDRKAKQRAAKRLASIKFRCAVCADPYTISTAMDEKTYCSLKCEGRK